MKDPAWLNADTLLALHEQHAMERGFDPALRDPLELEAALLAPEDLYVFGDPGLPALAARYAMQIVDRRPFLCGNGAAAFLAAYVFLRRNGLEVQAAPGDVTRAVRRLTDGGMTEDDFTSWLEAAVRRRSEKAPRTRAQSTRSTSLPNCPASSMR